MNRRRITKPRTAWRGTPNLVDYDAARRSFTWEAARAELDGLPGGGLNLAHEAVDRHAAGPRARHLAIRFVGEGGHLLDLTYAELARETSRFANVLDTLGVGAGEAVFCLTGRIPELYVAALGTLKHRSVFAPLFSAFGPEPIEARITRGEGVVLVTTARLYRKKVAPIRARLPTLREVLVVPDDGGLPEGTRSLPALLTAASDQFEIPPTNPEDRALLHFTSGTTGTPKGAIHVHEAVVAHHYTTKVALDLHPDDIFWCTADPGWVTGTSYGILGPLTIGATLIVDAGEFDADRWYQILESQGVSVWYTAPTAVRMMMKSGADLARPHRFDRLRFIASVGEPLNPEAVYWGEEVFGLPIHDNWWQTETGAILIANLAALEIRPGSMGRPLPGVEAAIVRHTDEGVAVLPAGEEGELALRPGWPSMFRGYLNQDDRYRACFASGWYLSGDLARMDADGYVWFVGRADDVIKSAGHLIGPFEVESVLLEHPAVAEAGVIGVPDPVMGELVKAFVSLKGKRLPDEALERELMALARTRLGPAVAPRTIAFLPSLPRTRSGKIMRRLLKARELGLPEGDLSTLEAAP